MFEQPSLQPPFFERNPEEIAADFLAFASEHFAHAGCKVRYLKGTRTVVDGFILRAGQVLEVAERDHVVFLFAAEDFQRDLWRKGGWYKNYIGDCEDPRRAAENFIEGMVCISRQQQRECEQLGVPVILTGGVRTVAEMLEQVRELPGFLGSHTVLGQEKMA